MNAIEFRGVTKRYGARRGITDVTFSVPQGALFGLIGPNGAGKSTALRTLLGLLQPTSGSTWLLGHDTRERGPASRGSVGYVPGENQFDPAATAGQVLDWRGRFFPGDHRARRRELVERFELELQVRAEDLSLGNKKKLALVAALQHRPKVLVLDEPTNGLDPVMQQRLFDTLEEEARAGAAVLFSSHVLSEVQRVCRTVAVLSEGALVALEDIDALRRRQLRRVTVDAPRGLEALCQLAGVTQLVVGPSQATFLASTDVGALLSALAALAPRDVRIEEPSLEEIVMQHYLKPGARHV